MATRCFPFLALCVVCDVLGGSQVSQFALVPGVQAHDARDWAAGALIFARERTSVVGRLSGGTTSYGHFEGIALHWDSKNQTGTSYRTGLVA